MLWLAGFLFGTEIGGYPWKKITLFKMALFCNLQWLWDVFEWKLSRLLPMQPKPMPTPPTVLIFWFSKKTSLVATSISSENAKREENLRNAAHRIGEIDNLMTLIWSEGGIRGTSVWRQLNNKKWAVRNFGPQGRQRWGDREDLTRRGKFEGLRQW